MGWQGTVRMNQGRKIYTTAVETLISFSGSEASMVYTPLSRPTVYTFSLCFLKENGLHHSLCCSVTLGSCERPSEEGVTHTTVYVTVVASVLQDLRPP